MSKITLHYSGVVIGLAKRVSGEMTVVVCAASKLNRIYTLLLLELIYPDYDSAQVDTPANGAIISGAGLLCQVEDDFIGIRPVKPLKTLQGDSEVDFTGKPWRSNRFPAAGRTLIKQALRKSKRCLDMNLEWEWLSPYAPCKAFSHLLSSALDDAASSLVTVSFSGMALAGHKAYGSQHKNNLFLATRQNPDYIQLPLLIDCGPNTCSCNIARGDIAEVTDVPVLGVKNDVRILLLQCGRSKCSKMDEDAVRFEFLQQLYDELINLSIGEDYFWPALFRRKPKALGRQILQHVCSKLDNRGIKPGEIVHGWWHPDWGFYNTVHAEKALPDILLILPDFKADKWSPRIIVFPKNKKWNLFDFVEKGCSISVSDYPEILEGSFRPDAKEWELLCRWIRLNKEALLKEFLDYDEIKPLPDDPGKNINSKVL